MSSIPSRIAEAQLHLVRALTARTVRTQLSRKQPRSPKISEDSRHMQAMTSASLPGQRCRALKLPGPSAMNSGLWEL